MDTPDVSLVTYISTAENIKAATVNTATAINIGSTTNVGIFKKCLHNKRVLSTILSMTKYFRKIVGDALFLLFPKTS